MLGCWGGLVGAEDGIPFGVGCLDKKEGGGGVGGLRAELAWRDLNVSGEDMLGGGWL